MKKLAVFDIDGTIIRSSLIIELVNGLVKNNIFPQIILKEIEKDFIFWINRQGSYENYIKNVVSSFQKYIKGQSVDEVMKTILEVINSQKDKTYIYTRELIKKLKKEDYFLLAISGSPEIIVSEFTKKLGFSMYYGTKYEIKNEKFTGEITSDIVWKKSDILNIFVKENNFSLDNSIGIGDSEIDISFLEIVKNPIAFNPDLKLAMYAKEKKWKIIVERKNVIYDIKKFNLESTN